MKQKELLALKLLKQMEAIEYGYLDHQQKKYFDADEQFATQYFLQTPQQLAQSQIGVCWDQVEYERDFFAHHQIACQTLAIVAAQDKNLPSHSLLYFHTKEKFCWFEHAWIKYSGLWYYETEQQLFQQFASRFLANLTHFQSWKIVKYSQPQFGINSDQYYQHLDQGQIIMQGQDKPITAHTN